MFYKEVYSNMFFEPFCILFLVFTNMSRQRFSPHLFHMFLLLEKNNLGNCLIKNESPFCCDKYDRGLAYTRLQFSSKLHIHPFVNK